MMRKSESEAAVGGLSRAIWGRRSRTWTSFGSRRDQWILTKQATAEKAGCTASLEMVGGCCGWVG
jgi:hypothetical protein